MRLQRIAIDHIHRAVKKAGDEFFEGHVFVDRPFRAGLEFDEDIDIAVWARVAAGNGTKNGRAPNATRPQSGLGLFQSRDDFVAVHRRAYIGQCDSWLLAGQ